MSINKNYSNKSEGEKERVILIEQLLTNLNQKYKLDDEVLQNTPNRFIKAFDELTCGYGIDTVDLIKSALFEAPPNYNELIILDKIEYNSLCQHHLLPFNGTCSIGYIPNTQILGLSKFARLVNAYSNRLTLQERLTMEVATSLQSNLNPKGVIVYIEGRHSCMCSRGVKSKNSITKTIYTTGEFIDNESKKKEFLMMINN